MVNCRRPNAIFPIQHFIRCNAVVIGGGGGDNLQSLTNLSRLRCV